MQKIVVLGAGKIGATIAHLLAQSGDYRVTLADQRFDPAQRTKLDRRITMQTLDATDPDALDHAFAQHAAVVNALPFHLTAAVARSAAANRVHYLDLTEDVQSTRTVKELAADAASALIPQCGLAPGFVSIAAQHIARGFEQLDNLEMRVGALPMYPSNALKYNLTWSTEGLINEYLKPCDAIRDGELIQVPALEEIESFSLDGVNYEAFNTSGGLGTLCESLAGQVKNLNYRTVRYPGHRDVMKLLLQDLRLKDHPALFKQILESALPMTEQDVVLVFITASGLKQGRFMQESYVNKIYNRSVNGQHLSAIQLTTAAGVCAVLDLLLQDELPRRGLVRQEEIDYRKFIGNRFGRYFAREQDRPEHRKVA